MSHVVDIRVTVDGEPIPLPVEVATMVLALVDHREHIRKQGAGCVSLDYHAHDVTIGVQRVSMKAKARSLVLSERRG